MGEIIWGWTAAYAVGVTIYALYLLKKRVSSNAK